MGKILAVLVTGAAFLLMLVIILALVTSMLANSMANLAMATVVLSQQCFVGLGGLLAIMGTALTVWNLAIQAQRRNAAPQMLPPAIYPATQSAVRPYFPQLMPGQRQLPAIYVAGEPVEEEEEVGDTLFSNWGW